MPYLTHKYHKRAHPYYFGMNKKIKFKAFETKVLFGFI